MSDVTGARAVAEPVAASRAAWWAVVSLAFGAFGLVTAEFLPVSLLTPMAAELGVSNGAVGQAVTATAVVAAIAGPLLVLSLGRSDRQKVVWGMMVLLVLSCLLSAYAESITTLLLSRAVLGFALGSFWAMMAALALRLVPSDQVPRAIAIIMMGVSLATVLAAPLGAYLGELLGWRASFVVAAGIGAVALLVQVLTLPSLSAVAAPGLATFKVALSRRSVRIGLGAALLIISGHFAGFTFIRPFLEEVPRFDASKVSLVLLAFGVGGFFGNLAGGAVAARSPAWAVASAALLVAVGALALLALGESAAVTFAALALWGFAFGGFPVAISIWNARAAPDYAESAGALLTSMFQIAIATGAVLGGVVIEGLGVSGVLVYSALATLLGAWLMLVLGRKSEKSRGL